MPPERRLGWIGTGRMGTNMVTRLLRAGHPVAVYNRTRAKAEPLAELGATIVDAPGDLAQCDIVFTMVTGPADFAEVVLGESGVLSAPNVATRIIVDSTTISPSASTEVRERAAERGVDVIAAPVSGNPKVVETGRLTLVVSGPRQAYYEVKPYLDLLGAENTYVGEGDLARVAKICHNLMLGVVAQCMAEITVLAEKSGIARADLLDFLNSSVMGSTFTRYKTPAFVNRNFEPTFTPLLLRKDFDLGFELAHAHDVPMPVSAAAAQVVQALIGSGRVDEDFATLLELQASCSDLELGIEDVAVGDGLEPLASDPVAAE
jgi:3-hydroxyisobutyrate dehydrogenase